MDIKLQLSLIQNYFIHFIMSNEETRCYDSMFYSGARGGTSHVCTVSLRNCVCIFLKVPGSNCDSIALGPPSGYTTSFEVVECYLQNTNFISPVLTILSLLCCIFSLRTNKNLSHVTVT